MTVTQENIRLVPASSDNIDVILSIYQRSPTYFHRVSGSSPTLETVQRDMVDQPKNKQRAIEKSSSSFTEGLSHLVSLTFTTIIPMWASHT